MPRLLLVLPACLALGCLRGGARLGGEHGDHICGPGENYSDVPEDCFDTPFVAAVPGAGSEAPGWHAWEGLCLVDGYDRLAAGNGVCELQESLWFRADCEPTCGDGALEGDDAQTCIADWLAVRRANGIGPKLCGEGEADCCKDQQCTGEEDACNCPEDCADPDDYGRVRDDSGETTTEPDSSSGETTMGATDSESESSTGETTMAPPECGDGACDPDEDVNNCPEDCNICGDGVAYGGEACDNGVNEDPAYSETPPGPDACAAGCVAVEYCGDAVQNGDEPCDEGEQTATCEADCRFPSCGDGIHNPLADEACDDNNIADGDGCSSECVIERRVFATSASYEGDIRFMLDNPDGLSGIALADARCNALAEAVSLTGIYKAWLSDSDDSPASRFDTTFEGLYRLLSTDYPILAEGWSSLVAGPLNHAIDADENGMPISGIVWTNTQVDGTTASVNDCQGWTSSLPDVNAKPWYGVSGSMDEGWTQFDTQTCLATGHLYCFEDI